MIKLIETQSDLDIKNDLYRFIDGDYDSYFTPDQIEYGIEYSFLLNFSEIQEHRFIFNYREYCINFPFDDIIGLPNDQIKSTIFYWTTKDQIFKGALASFLRDYKLSKLIE